MVQCSCRYMLTGQLLLAKSPELWSQPGDVKGDGGKTNAESKARAGKHSDVVLTNQQSHLGNTYTGQNQFILQYLHM